MTVLGTNTERYEVTVAEDSEAKVALSWGFATDVGHKRAHNEDSLVADGTVFAVADGMGGHSAGDTASTAVVTQLSEKANGEFMSAESVMQALMAATIDISHALDERGVGSGTTATGIAMTVHSGHPYWVVFNVGDSRVYFFERNTLTQMTVDHSVVHELVAAGLISSQEAEHHPDSNVVTRAVGFNAVPEPDFWLIPVTSGSRILICSDGLTREVNDRRLRLHLAAGLNSEETAHALIDAALAEGGRDNVTAIVIDVLGSKNTDTDDPLEIERTEQRR